MNQQQQFRVRLESMCYEHKCRSDRRARYFLARGQWRAAKDYRSWRCALWAVWLMLVYVFLTILLMLRGRELDLPKELR